MDRHRRISPTAAWVVFCAFCTVAGWSLSILHRLNRGGYLLAFLIGGIGLILWWRKNRPLLFPCPIRSRLARRFRRPLPMGFLILTTLAFIGGVLYAPTNYDGLTYRVPRVLHWLSEDRWHWIHTFFPRLNTRAVGYEWVSAPVLALLRTDRVLFLINTVCIALLPGLVFSVFTRVGVRPRVAWHWMWIFPTGYCFLLQAGSIGNDLFGAVLVLAAVDFALRASQTKTAGNFWISMLAAGLLTNAKLSNLPLLAPWAVALLPSWSLLMRWPLRTAAVGLIAVAVSLLPISALNLHYCHDWTGLSTEGLGMQKNLLVQVGANAVLTTTDNFVPPIFPMASKWNQFVERSIPPRLAVLLDQTMETPGGNKLAVRGEMQIEENAGLGFGVSVLLVISVLGATIVRWRQRGATPNPHRSLYQTCVRWSPVIPFLVFVTQSNLSGPGRILTPYYALLLPIFLAADGHAQLVRRRWWRASALVVFAIALAPLVLSPARPLFPVKTVLNKLEARAGGSRLFTRALTVYTVYGQRNRAFAPALAVLPPDLKVLGLISYDDPETSLWRPFGSRTIMHVRLEDTPADLKQRGIEYILVNHDVIGQWFFKSTREEWLTRMNAQVVRTIPLKLRAERGVVDWYLVKLN
jgi:hypothetical protein